MASLNRQTNICPCCKQPVEKYAESLLFQSPNPRSIPPPQPFLSDIKYCKNLNEKQKKYIKAVKKNWKGEILRLKTQKNKNGNLKFPVETNAWINELKPLGLMPDIMKDICYLLKQNADPSKPEDIEWRFEHLSSGYSGLPLYNGMGHIVKHKFIKSLEYLHKDMGIKDIPFSDNSEIKRGGKKTRKRRKRTKRKTKNKN